MDSKFLKEVLGQEGFKIIKRAVDKTPQLQSVIVPRTIISWLSTNATIGYEGEIPGLNNSYIALKKSDNGYNGAVVVDDRLYELDNADILHVAASVGVSLGLELEPIDKSLQGGDLSELGKNIDLLVKSNIIKKIRSTQPAKSTTEKFLKITKRESEIECEECGGNQFINNKLVGCICINDICKSIKTEEIEEGFILKFDMKELDEEAFSTVLSMVKE